MISRDSRNSGPSSGNYNFSDRRVIVLHELGGQVQFTE